MANKIWRLIFTILLTLTSGLLGWYGAVALTSSTLEYYKNFFSDHVSWQPIYQIGVPVAFSIFGVALGLNFFRRIEKMGEAFTQMSARDRIALIGGLVIGLALSAVLSIPVFAVFGENKLAATASFLLTTVVVMYLSTVAAVSLKDEIHFYMPPAPAAEENPLPKEHFKILDTNVIIDGRIADVARTGFLEGPLYVPGFVLDELQHIADSSDSLKRARGRRGLDILNGMQKELTLIVRSYDKFAPGHEEVDSRLVRLAKALDATLVTNDFNLNKVAELQGVPVFNVNELANALKPVVLPGEEMRVAVVKEGKEPSQGVAYLDDGTMIVIEGGRRHMGETVDVQVASVLQTQAGKMIFAHMADDHDGEGNESYARNVRDYTSRRPRRPVR